MADASKLKAMRRPGLGAPPPPDEARADLAPAPEPSPLPLPPPLAEVPAGPPAAVAPPARVDGRTLRRSGRTMQFATRVSPEFDERVRRIAARDGMLLVEVLEKALDAYESGFKKAAR